jgi:drug/metabolite transporter (DMT)-like permease
VAILLALAGAAVVGSGDFFGGVAAKHGRVLAVVLWVHLVGVGAMVLIGPLLGGDPTAADLWWGAAAGASGSLGVVALYHGFATSRVGVVAPISAVVAAVLPVLYGVIDGERPGPVVVAGLAVGVVAIALVSRPSADDTEGNIGGGVVRGLAAGLAFGALFILFSRVGDDAGAWPVLPARAAGAGVLLTAILARRDPLVPARASQPVVALGGVVAAVGTGLFVLAFQRGLLSVVSVLTSMYPAASIAWARVIFAERLTGVQWMGVALALLAVGLIAAG